jgi:hypothetical protein
MLQDKLARHKGKIIAVVAGLVVLASIISGAAAIYQDTGTTVIEPAANDSINRVMTTTATSTP